jgi:TM2 domain-containing membrane protein YozV
LALDKATKAALFSALLFPGWGQFYLKRYKRGLVFIMPVLIGTLALVWAIVQVGITIIKAVPFKKGTVQLANVIQVTVDALKTIDFSYFLFILCLIAALWILSIIDAYLLGKKMMTAPTTDVRQESTSDQQ